MNVFVDFLQSPFGIVCLVSIALALVARVVLTPRRGQARLQTRDLWLGDASGRVKAKICVEVPSTLWEKTVGLRFRNILGENEGMYFLFGKKGYWPMTMRNTLVPLDLIFIDQDVIVSILPGVPLSRKSRVSRHRHDTVLELRLGFCNQNGIKEGDRVYLRDPSSVVRSNSKNEIVSKKKDLS